MVKRLIGDRIMIEKRIMCPSCNKQITVKGKPDETKYITCPNCNKKSKFTFKSDHSKPEEKKESSIINVKNLTKRYKDVIAVNNISFDVKKGEIFGFLGPNGAGKTTTIKSILGLINTNSGEIKIDGFNIKTSEKQAKKNIGYLPEKVAFYDNLTALQNLHFYAEMKDADKDECKVLIEEFGLKDAINKKVGGFSKGMQQRLGMARAILGKPSILILDEPSGGLDPRGVLQIRKKIKELKMKDTTIFVSSHILSEIQEICDRVGIINKGRIVAKDTVNNLSKKLNIKPKMTIQLDKVTEKITKSVKEIKGIEKIDITDKSIEVVCDSEIKSKIILAVEKAGGNIMNLQTHEPSLEEVFMRYTEE